MSWITFPVIAAIILVAIFAGGLAEEKSGDEGGALVRVFRTVAGAFEWVVCLSIHVPTYRSMDTGLRVPIWRRYDLPLENGKPCATCRHQPKYNLDRAERALAYVERAIDRQINKVRGILAVDSILLVASRLAPRVDGNGWGSFFLQESQKFLYIAIVLCLFMFLLRFSRSYGDFYSEFKNTVELFRRRAVLVQLAVALSMLALIGLSLTALGASSKNDQLHTSSLQPAPPNQKLANFDEVYFDVNASDPRRDSLSKLGDILRLLRNNPALRFRLEGHADETGTDLYNFTLSVERATAIKRWLASHGIESDRLIIKGFGNTDPVADNHTTEGRGENRRVEFVALPPK